MVRAELDKIKKIIEDTDERFSVNVWEKYGKQNIYISVGRTDKKITVHIGSMKIYANRPGAYTEANAIAEALTANDFNFIVE